MKKLLLLLLMFSSLFSFGQDKDSSVIWFYRPSNFFGGGCGVNILVGNQEYFTIANGETIKYNIYSTGKVLIKGESFCGAYKNNMLTIDIKSGENYYISSSIGKPISLGERSKIDDKKVIELAEDIRNPINKSTRKSGPSSGTGFLLSESGLVITNHHVIEKANKIQLKGINGDYTTTYTAKVLADDEKNDLAILQIDNKTIKFDPIPYTIRSKGADTGEEIYVLGYPMITAMGEEVKLTTGVVSAKTGYQGDITSYQVSAPVQGGNSGGPLFDKQGNLTGIINSKIMEAEGVTYAIKTNYLNALIDLLPTSPVLNDNNKLTGLSMQEQVKQLSKFVYIIEVNN